MDITKQTPREIDTTIAKLEEPLAGFRQNLAALEKQIQDRVQFPERYRYYSAKTVEQLEVLVAEQHAKITAQRALIAPYDAEFVRRGGWSRYFLVPGGHVHRERNCSSCHWNTLFGWLPTLSGCDELAMVAEHGDNACAICFPAVQNHPAFLAAKALRLAAEASQAALLCPGSGKAGESKGAAGFSRYRRCPHCKKVVYAGPRGYSPLRKHKAKS